MGATRAEQILIEGVGGNSSIWAEEKAHFFPLGFDENLFVNNGHADYTISAKYPFRGSTGQLSLMPDFSFQLPIKETNSVSGTELFSQNLPAVLHGKLLRLKSDAARWSIHEDAGAGPIVETQYFPVALKSNNNANNSWGGPTWVTDGLPNFFAAVSGADMAARQPETFRLAIGSTTEPIPTGAELTITIPLGWSVESTMSPNWTSSSRGNILSFRASSAILPPSPIEFSATPPQTETEPFATMTARFGNGSLAESTLILQYPSSPDTSFPRLTYATYPYPIYNTTRALFGIALANGGAVMTVDHVDLDIPGGYDLEHNGGKGVPLFTDTLGDDYHDSSQEAGSWTHVDDRHLRWTPKIGIQNVTPDTATWWAVEAPITSNADNVTAVENPQSPGPIAQVTLSNGLVVNSTEWGASPGIIRVEIPPENSALHVEGYPSSTSGATTFNYTARVSEYPATVVQNKTASYVAMPGAADALAIQRGTQNATFAVENRTVNLGGVMRIHGDMSSLVGTLKQEGITTGSIGVDVYAPPSLGCHPTSHIEQEIGSMPHAKLTAVRYFAADGVPSVIAASQDRHVYRVGVGGALLWASSVALGSVPIDVAVGTGDSALFVLDSGGTVTSIDPTLGTAIWSRAVGTVADRTTAVPDASAHIALDAVNHRVVVGTSGGALVAIDSATGADASVPVALSGAVLSVSCSSTGDCFAITSNEIAAINAAGQLRSAALTQGLGFAIASDGILAADGASVRSFSADLSSTSIVLTRLSAPALVASGDATGDAVDDLLEADSNGAVLAVSGAALHASWTTAAPVISGSNLGGEGIPGCDARPKNLQYDQSICTLP